ncbi:hypothetical protein TNCV_2050641 [Trichonephila clavipes]|nr:hypothetical protein TNCV_2050641 [Trichonephila clavipes]
MSNADDSWRNWRISEVLPRTSNGRNDLRDKPGLTHVLYHEIDTGHMPPVVSRPYRYGRVKQTILDYHIEKVLKEGTIIPIQSPGAEDIRCGQGGDNEIASFKFAGFQKAFRVVYECRFNRRRPGSKSGAETSGVCLSYS